MSREDIGRRIAAAARRPIAAAVATEADRVAAALAAAAPGSTAGSMGRAGGLKVTLTGPGLFAREFGAIDSAADPIVAPALRRLKRRPA